MHDGLSVSAAAWSTQADVPWSEAAWRPMRTGCDGSGRGSCASSRPSTPVPHRHSSSSGEEVRLVAKAQAHTPRWSRSCARCAGAAARHRARSAWRTGRGRRARRTRGGRRLTICRPPGRPGRDRSSSQSGAKFGPLMCPVKNVGSRRRLALVAIRDCHQVAHRAGFDGLGPWLETLPQQEDPHDADAELADHGEFLAEPRRRRNRPTTAWPSHVASS